MTELSTSPKTRRTTLFLCFAVPALLMAVTYFALGVTPFGKKSVLVLDLNAQYIYFFEELREILTGGDSIVYSFKRALGGEFMGIFAYYLSSPFSLIVALFPKKLILEAMFTMLVVKCGFTGLTFGYLIQKKFDFRRSVTVMFSVLYAFSSYAVIMQHNVMWTDNLIAFPLLLLGMDALITRGKYKMFVLSLAYAVLSNFYLGWMACLFVLIWFFARYFMLSPEERNPLGEERHFVKSLVRIGLWSLLALLMSAVILLPIYYSLSFGKLEFSTPDWKPKQLFPFLDLLTKAFFGSYDTVRPTGMPHLYCGTLALVLCPLYFFAKKIPRRRKIGFLAVLGFLVVSFNLSTLDIIWHGMQRPNWLNARFAYMFVALLLLLAAEGMRHLGEIGGRAVMLSAILWCGALLVCDKIGYENLPDFRAVWAGVFCFALVAACVPPIAARLRQGLDPGRASAVLCAVVIAEAFANAVVSLYALDEDVSFSKRTSYRQILDTYEPAVAMTESDESFFRLEKLIHRKKNDNFALGIRGLSNSTSTLNARTIALLAQFGYGSQSHWSMYAGATAVTDALFDIKYILADETAPKAVMRYIHDLYDHVGTTDTAIDVYKNPYALGIAYAAQDAILSYDAPAPANEEKDYVDPFTYMNGVLSALTGEKIAVWRRADPAYSDTEGCELVFATGHRGYQKEGSGGANISFTIDIESTDDLYCYFPSRWPRECTLHVNDNKLGTYFDSENLSVRELGSFEPGEVVHVQLVLKKDDLYIRSGVPYFWYFDEDAFLSAVALLENGAMEAKSDSDAHITGTVNVPEGRDVLFTTIPYDKGWRITVDGKQAALIPVLNESLIAVRVTPGEHRVEFTYDPDCVRHGLNITLGSTLFFALMWVWGGRFEIHLPKKKKA